MKLQELLKDVAVKNSTAAQDIDIKEVRSTPARYSRATCL